MEEAGKELIQKEIPDLLKNRYLPKINVGEKVLRNKDHEKLNEHITVYKPKINIHNNKKYTTTVHLIQDSEILRHIPIPQYADQILPVYEICWNNNGNSTNEQVENDTLDVKISTDINIKIDQFTYPLVRCPHSKYWKVQTEFKDVDGDIRLSCVNGALLTLIREIPNEKLVIPAHGGMIYSKINKAFSLRVPKGNFKDEKQCKYQVIPMPDEVRDEYKEMYLQQFQGIDKYSEIICVDLINEQGCRQIVSSKLRRSVTIKLPIPQWVIDELSSETSTIDFKVPIRDQMKESPNFLLLQESFSDNSWAIVQAPLLYSETSVTFDTSSFGRYQFVKCRKNREIRLSNNISMITDLVSCSPGVMLAFLHTSSAPYPPNHYGGCMSLWFEVCRIGQVQAVRDKLEKQHGLVFLQAKFDFNSSQDGDKNNNYRKLKKASNETEELRRQSFELIDNLQIHIRVTGDLVRRDEREAEEELEKAALQREHNKENDELNETNAPNLDGVMNIGARKKRKLRWDDQNEEKQLQENNESCFGTPDIIWRKDIMTCNTASVEVVPKRLTPITLDDSSTKENEAWNQKILDKYEKEKSLMTNGLRGPESSSFIQIPNTDEQMYRYDIDPKLLEASSECYQYHKAIAGDTNHQTNFPLQINYKMKYPDYLQNPMSVPNQTIKVYIPACLMKQYFNIVTEHEKIAIQEQERLEQEKQRIIQEELEKQKTELNRSKQPTNRNPRTISQNRINGLARPRVMNQLIEREPKVVSRRSFLALSSVVRKGLTLGVYLGLPDAVIAGIGFDSLSQLSSSSSSSNGLTYRVLVSWKRACIYNKIPESEYVKTLCTGLEKLDMENLSLLVYHCWTNKKELSLDDCQRSLLQADFIANLS